MIPSFGWMSLTYARAGSAVKNFVILDKSPSSLVDHGEVHVGDRVRDGGGSAERSGFAGHTDWQVPNPSSWTRPMRSEIFWQHNDSQPHPQFPPTPLIRLLP